MVEGTKHTDRKNLGKCSKKKEPLVKKQEHVQKKLAKLRDKSDSPKREAKIAKLEEKLAAITSMKLGAEKPDPNVSSGILRSDGDTNKQLIPMKSKFFVMKSELRQDKHHVASLAKTLEALRVISRHGSSAGISFDDKTISQTSNQLAAKKVVIQQQKALLSLMKSQLKKDKKDKKKKEKQEKKDKKDKKDMKDKKDQKKKDKKDKKDRKDKEKMDKKDKKDKKDKEKKYKKDKLARKDNKEKDKPTNQEVVLY